MTLHTYDDVIVMHTENSNKRASFCVKLLACNISPFRNLEELEFSSQTNQQTCFGLVDLVGTQNTFKNETERVSDSCSTF